MFANKAVEKILYSSKLDDPQFKLNVNENNFSTESENLSITFEEPTLKSLE